MGWEVVDEVEPITCLLSNLWDLLLSYAYIAMLCVDVVWLSDIHDRCEIDN